MAILIDIDGTLANIEHRRYLVEGEKKNWDKFKYEAINDTPNLWCVEIIKGFITTGSRWQLVFVTGRNENFYLLTTTQIEKWLHLCCNGYKLFMRKEDDFRSDIEVKEEIYNTKLKQYNFLFAIDDSKEIVNLWRSKGIVTLDCAGYQRTTTKVVGFNANAKEK